MNLVCCVSENVLDKRQDKSIIHFVSLLVCEPKESRVSRKVSDVVLPLYRLWPQQQVQILISAQISTLCLQWVEDATRRQ